MTREQEILEEITTHGVVNSYKLAAFLARMEGSKEDARAPRLNTHTFDTPDPNRWDPKAYPDVVYPLRPPPPDAWEDWLDYNSTDMGEMGKYIRTEYAKNGTRMALETARTTTLDEVEKVVEGMKVHDDGTPIHYASRR
jgi:hypothetical protein